MPTHCTISRFRFRIRQIDGIECGLFSIHALLGQRVENLFLGFSTSSWEKQKPLTDIARVQELTASACGVGVRSVQRIIGKARKVLEIVMDLFLEPVKLNLNEYSSSECSKEPASDIK